MIFALGAPARTAASRAMSSAVPSLIFNSGRCAFFAASARIRSGSSSDSVKAVSIGPGVGRPARSHTRLPARLAAQSHSAQSTALRAAPGGSAACRSRREISSGRLAISAATLSRVSP